MLLVIGLLLWSSLHLLPAIAPGLRAQAIERLGPGPYKGLFSILIVLAVVSIVLGFRGMPVSMLYIPPAGLRHLTMLLMPIALILFVASALPNDLKRVIRHPQMIAVKTWALAHLLANGETRSVLLFGGLLAWAVLEVIFINRRDGDWQKPAAVGALRTSLVVLLGLAATAVMLFAHPWIAGVSLFSR